MSSDDTTTEEQAPAIPTSSDDGDARISVDRDDAARRYVIRVGDVTAGFSEFRADADRLRFVHTQIEPAFGGRGLATTLVAEAMADVAARGEEVVPLCPFVAKYLESHDVPGLVVDWPAEADGA
jgi:predicted GNAT family acetyltransferase